MKIILTLVMFMPYITIVIKFDTEERGGGESYHSGSRFSKQSCTSGMIHTKIHPISPHCPQPSIQPYSAASWKTQQFHSTSFSYHSKKLTKTTDRQIADIRDLVLSDEHAVDIELEDTWGVEAGLVEEQQLLVRHLFTTRFIRLQIEGDRFSAIVRVNQPANQSLKFKAGSRQPYMFCYLNYTIKRPINHIHSRLVLDNLTCSVTYINQPIKQASNQPITTCVANSV